jgi:molecular chaperone DnaJ
VVISVRDHESFERVEDDLVCTRDISYPLAALGGRVRVETLEGPQDVDVPKGSQDGDVVTLEGAGLPLLRKPDQRGDLRIGLRLVVPRRLSAEQRRLLEELASLDATDGEEIRPPEKSFFKKIKDSIAGSET